MTSLVDAVFGFFLLALFIGSFVYVLWDLDELLERIGREEMIDELWMDDDRVAA